MIKSLIRSTEGATATEYAVMLAMIIMVVLAAVSSLGVKVNSIFAAVTDADW